MKGFYVRKLVFIAALCSISLAAEVSGPVYSLDEVRSSFGRGFKGKAECSALDYRNRVFCIDGHYFTVHSKKLREKATVSEELIGSIIKEAPADVFERQAYLRTAGLAFSHFQKDVSTFNELLARLKEEDRLFAIDGWAADQYRKFGYEKSKGLCEAEKSEPLRSACFWGMGRGFFYSKLPAGRSLEFNEFFVAGYLFSKSLSTPDTSSWPVARKIKIPGVRLGEMYKLALQNSKVLTDENPKIRTCFVERHISKCLDL